MADEEGKTEGEGKESETFDPKSLSKEAQEYIRREVQSESDTKAQLAETRLRAEVAQNSRSATETAEQNELNQLAATGQHEALGQRIALRLNQRSVEEAAVGRASDAIERQMSDLFSQKLGPERVEQIRREVVQKGGAHAEFAQALADVSSGESRKDEIAAEVKAQMLEAGGHKRDEVGGSSKVSDTGDGRQPSGFEEIEQGYTEGTVSREVYAEAKKAR